MNPDFISQGNIYRIMIVDDSKTFLSGICALLNSKFPKSELLCMNSQTEALDSIKQNPPDIIIYDLEMSETNGFDFIKLLRHDSKLKTTPILVMTNQTDTDSMSKSISIGADAFCSKDTIRYTLEPHIQALLRLKQNYESELNRKHIENLQILIGVYKHEFGNALAIVEGMLRKYKNSVPESKNHVAFAHIDSGLKRIGKTLDKLDELRNLKQIDDFSMQEKLLKMG